MKKIQFSIVLIISIIGILLFLGFSNDLKVENVNNCKVLELQQQQLISGSGNNITTEIRYLVITDKETFICETSLINGKFDNSNIFFRLEKGKVYNFKVCGYGKGFLFKYRNILEYNLQNQN